MENFGLIEKLVMTVKFKEDKEHLFELNDIEIIFYMLKVEVKCLKRKLLKLFVNFIVVRLFLR